MSPANHPSIGVLASPEALRAAFVEGLERQLAAPGLGAFILVLANAGFDAEIWTQMAARLEARFDVLAAEIRGKLALGARLAYPEDDLVVFLKLMAMGFGAIRTTQTRAAGPWELQFNPLRALRPARSSGLKAASCQAPAFNPDGFQFNKPFLRPEILWEGRLLSHDARLLYNKFPFAPLHTLLVPEPEQGHAQQLSQEMHHYAWHLMKTLGADLPGLLVAFNSYGAQASVNHLHFQLAVRDVPLPLAAARWTHNGGAETYPARCETFSSPTEAWLRIDQWHRAGTPFNLIYSGGRLYCLPRQPQGGYDTAAWSAGHAWYEMAGGVVTFSREDFDALGADDVTRELNRTRNVP